MMNADDAKRSPDDDTETVQPPTSTGGNPHPRGGRIDISNPKPRNRVDEASEESFPASDPPSNTPPEARK